MDSLNRPDDTLAIGKNHAKLWCSGSSEPGPIIAIMVVVLTLFISFEGNGNVK